MAKVLIVDDASFMRKRMSDVLKELGHLIVAEAENGKEAIGLYIKHKPDLVTMDITMPELSGKDALKQIIKIDPKAKIIMCSALGSEQVIAECIKAGAKSYIVKPYNKEKVDETIKKVLG
jgi:two-component system, chemotaxis family, chemotaxis protein CheY